MSFSSPPPPSPLAAASAEPVPFAVACPTCHGAVAVPAALAGGPARCPLCNAGFLAPTPQASPTPRTAAAPPAESTAPQAPAPQAAAPARSEPSAGPAPEPKPTPRRRSVQERSARRSRRNLIMLVSGVAMLLTIVLALGTKRKRR